MPASSSPSSSSVRRPARTVAARARATGAAIALAGSLAAALTGCAPTGEEPRVSPSPAQTVTATPGAPSTPVADDPVLVSDGTAEDNLPLFAEVVRTVAASADKAKGRAYIDALVRAGFDKSAMEVTADRTTVDNPVDSLQFSVAWDGECLVGQVGPSTPRPTAVVLPELPDGGCLVGRTRPIDW